MWELPNFTFEFSAEFNLYESVRSISRIPLGYVLLRRTLTSVTNFIIKKLMFYSKQSFHFTHIFLFLRLQFVEMLN